MFEALSRNFVGCMECTLLERKMESVSRQTAPVLEKTYQFVLWLIPTVDKFPRAKIFAGQPHPKFRAGCAGGLGGSRLQVSGCQRDARKAQLL